MGLSPGCVFSVYPSPLWWLREYILCLIIIIKSEVWTITHCLGLGHETMVCTVCLSIFLYVGSICMTSICPIHAVVWQHFVCLRGWQNELIVLVWHDLCFNDVGHQSGMWHAMSHWWVLWCTCMMLAVCDVLNCLMRLCMLYDIWWVIYDAMVDRRGHKVTNHTPLNIGW